MKYFKWILIISLVIYSCSKEPVKENTNHKPQADFTITDEIDGFQLVDKSTDIDGDALTKSWSSIGDSIQFVSSYYTFCPDNSPAIIYTGSSDTNDVKIKLVVSDGQLSDSIIKDFNLPKITLVRRYGLGRKLNYEHSNNVSYNWYYDQMIDGYCGPASVTMAIKWADENFDKTPQDATDVYPFRPNSWWFLGDVISYLNKYSISNKSYGITNIDTIQAEIDRGNIVILCADMYYISKEQYRRWHLGLFYEASIRWGHFFVVKGYKIVDGQVFYEVYDPYSMGKTYDDGTLKGKDRYYRSKDVNQAVMNWDSSIIIVSKGSS